MREVNDIWSQIEKVSHEQAELFAKSIEATQVEGADTAKIRAEYGKKKRELDMRLAALLGEINE